MGWQSITYKISYLQKNGRPILTLISTTVQVKGYLEDGLDEALQGCDVVVVPAGVPRKPG